MNSRLSMLALALMLTVGSSVFAHGPQLQITNDNGKIITRELFLDEPYDTLKDPKSVYIIPMLPSGGIYFSRPNPEEAAPGVPAFNSGPGVAYGLGATFAGGFELKLSFVDSLKIWDGASFVDPGLEQLQAFRGSVAAPTATATTSDAGPFASITLPTIPASYGVNQHTSISYRMLGDGINGTASSDDGVYLVSFVYSSTDTSVQASDPFHFLLRKNSGLGEALVAARSLGFSDSQIQVVPEVGSHLLVAGALLAIAAMMIWNRCSKLVAKD